MTSIFQSAILQALGYAITNSIWQMAILWLLYLLCSGLMKNSARKKYNTAVVIQVLGFIWFLFTFRFYLTQYTQVLVQQDLTVATNVAPTIIETTGNGFKSLLIRAMIRAELLLPYLSAAYLLLMGVLLIRWYMGHQQIRNLRSQGLQPIPEAWHHLLDELVQRMEIGRKVGIYLSEKVASPLTIGFLKPLVLLPVASINHLSIAQLEAIILHELAHIKRWDYLVNILLSITEIGLFFNPFTQLLAKQIRQEREHCCDDWVLACRYNPTTYAEALLHLARLQPSPVFSMSAAGNGQHELLGRIKRMVGIQERNFNYRKQLMAFLLVTGILSSIAWLHPKQDTTKSMVLGNSNASQQQEELVKPVSVEPMAVKVSNPLFNPAFFLSDALKKEVQENLDAAVREINSTEVREALQQVPQAFSEASTEIMNQKHILLQGLALENARKAMSQAYQVFDSIPNFFPGALRIRDEAISKTISTVGASLSNVEAALKEIGKQTAETLSEVDQNVLRELQDANVGQEVQMALDQIKKLNLDKFIPNLELDKIIEQVKRDARNEPPKATPKNKQKQKKDSTNSTIQVVIDDAIYEFQQMPKTTEAPIAYQSEYRDQAFVNEQPTFTENFQFERIHYLDALLNRVQFAVLTDTTTPFIQQMILAQLLRLRFHLLRDGVWPIAQNPRDSSGVVIQFQ